MTRLERPSVSSIADPDAAALKRAQLRLDNFSRVFMNAADPILVADLDGNVIDCNDAALRTYGWTHAELVGQPAKMLLPSESQRQADEWLTRCRAGEDVRNVAVDHRTKLGELIPVLVSFSPLADAEGRPQGIAAIARDLRALREISQLRAVASSIAMTEEHERREFASDLHDCIGQLLSLLSIKARALREAAQGESLLESVREVEELVRQVGQQVSTLTFDLSPPLLYDVGLVAAAEWLAERMKERYGRSVALEVEHEIDGLDDTARVTLYRALREALINAAKHASIDHACIEIEKRAGRISITITDGGVGFDTDSATGRCGLISMRERIEHLGGSVQIDSEMGRGTTVSLSLPAGREVAP
jgi:PAS domain S-box-containing protein